MGRGQFSKSDARAWLQKSLLFAVRDFPRWLFLAVLLYLPWDYGGTSPRSLTYMSWSLGIVVGLWLLGSVIRRQKPEIPGVLLIATVAVVILGWFMTLNARAIYDAELELLVPLQNWLPFGPSTVDELVSFPWMIRATVLIGSLLFVVDLARRSEWLLRIWITIAIAGGSLSLLGLLQRATGAVLPFWEYQPWELSTFFATYYYHANAGAFLNLVFPLTAGLALRAFQKPHAFAQRALWSTAALLILASMLINTSRAGQVIGFLAVVAFAAGPARHTLMYIAAINRARAAAALVVVLFVLFSIAQASGVIKPLERWRSSIAQIPKDERWQAYKIATHILPDSSWFGFGPGTFHLVFPYYERVEGVPEPGGWHYLHEDYLQTIVEWGWIGAALWAVPFGGAIVAGTVALGRLSKLNPRPRSYKLLPLVLIALGAVSVHSLVDFPLQVASLQLYTATYIGIAWGCFQSRGDSV
jgi:hypothetical protein